MRTLARFFLFLAPSIGLLAAACTTTTTYVTPTDDAGTDGGRKPTATDTSKNDPDPDEDPAKTDDAGKPTPPARDGGTGSKKDAGPTDPNDPAGTCPDNLPITAADLDAEVGWKPARAPNKSACTAADIAKIETNSQQAGLQSFFDLGTGIGASCKACAFSRDTDASWAPIVGTAADNGQTGFFNYGSCFSAFDSSACGKAVQYSEFCTGIACNECATTQAEMTACAAAASDPGGMCNAISNSVTTSCPNLQTAAQACGGSVLTAIQALCGP
jgi:hypothetical protein